MIVAELMEQLQKQDPRSEIMIQIKRPFEAAENYQIGQVGGVMHVDLETARGVQTQQFVVIQREIDTRRFGNSWLLT